MDQLTSPNHCIYCSFVTGLGDSTMDICMITSSYNTSIIGLSSSLNRVYLESLLQMIFESGTNEIIIEFKVDFIGGNTSYPPTHILHLDGMSKIMLVEKARILKWNFQAES